MGVFSEGKIQKTKKRLKTKKHMCVFRGKNLKNEKTSKNKKTWVFFQREKFKKRKNV